MPILTLSFQLPVDLKLSPTLCVVKYQRKKKNIELAALFIHKLKPTIPRGLCMGSEGTGMCNK